jgi:hypothetical protein
MCKETQPNALKENGWARRCDCPYRKISADKYQATLAFVRE